MITINRNSESPIYKQIYDQLKNDILNNTLKSGTRLPATRTLSAEYKISRNSVVAAYEQLSIEGYIKSIVGSGYYVEELNYYNFHNENNFSIPSHNQVSNTVDEPKYNFRYGNLEFNCYQDSNWRKCITSTIDYLSMNESINYLPPEGLLCLRETLSEFLNRTRGVKCIPEQIIVTAGHQAALDIISNLFNSNSYSFAIEEPGYDGCREVFIRNGFTPIAIPIIEDGINIDSAKKLKKSLLYITPSHQFPTGSILPISKRLGLLEYVAKNDNYIIEDDYDSELRYNSMPIPSLQSLDINDRTIYLGTFSKSLSPDLRVAYIVLPFRLIDTYKKIYKVSNSNVPTLLQRALFEYIKSGGYERFINTIRTHYKQKNNLIISNLNIKKEAIIGADAGLHFLINFETTMNQEEIINHFLKYDVAVYPTKRYWINTDLCPHNQILVGYSSISSKSLNNAIECFNMGIEHLKDNNSSSVS